MTEEDAQEYFRTLSRFMKEVDIGWVVAQVKRQIAVGKIRPKKLSGREVVNPSEDSAANTGKTFLSSEPYSASEQLLLLLDAIERAVVATSEMQASFFEIMEDGPQRIAFAAGAVGEVRHSVSSEDLARHSISAMSLKAILSEIRREVASGN